MAQHNLGTVVSFEFLRTISKKRFWAGTLAVPVIMAVIFILIYISNSSTASAADAQENAQFSISYTDASGLITPEQAELFKATQAASPEQGVEAVRAGSVDAYFAFPANPASTEVKVYGADQGIFENNKYSAVAEAMLTQAVNAQIGSPELSTLAAGKASIDVTTFKDGQEAGGFNAALPPLAFLVIFYALIILLAGQMLSSTLEEKENRVTEMILTTLNPTTLISGKVLALFGVGAVQILVFASPFIIGYLFFREQVSIPDFDLTALLFEPVPMIIGLLLLIGGFTLFTTTLVAIGAVMPTAKEAGNFMGVMMALIFVPFYAISLIFSNPQALIVQVFTYFPFSSPVTAMLRNGLGSLSLWEAAIVIAILFIGSAIMFRLAVRLFQYGSISYTSKVNIKTALSSQPRAPKAADKSIS
ncbi:ABC transporter permease [Pseudarthrobacter sp. HLT3-5]|uniref:ABC transporter permease n=1 Tax=Pseudarthrobacter cellobiosi TaxID=2953654 RepID=UPI00208DEBE2|nr:ABC transporter permease [Pseudarthrobacter sp. HLT3-5]MCO4273839.1 ABC transporter permease [Pseudarthrobacter sp. HLT3-5]